MDAFWNTSLGQSIYTTLSFTGGTNGTEIQAVKELTKIINLPYEIDEDTATLIAWIGNKDEDNPIFVDAHIDTVCPTKMIPIIENKRLTATWLDNRLGCGYLLELAKERPKQNKSIALIFSGMEECGMHGAKFASTYRKWKSGLVFDVSPSNDIFATECKNGDNTVYVHTQRTKDLFLEPLVADSTLGYGPIIEPKIWHHNTVNMINKTNCIQSWQYSAKNVMADRFPCNISKYTNVQDLRYVSIALGGEMHGISSYVHLDDVVSAYSLIKEHLKDMQQ